MAFVVHDLLDRPVYGFRQVDRVLALGAGTTARWVDGYTRGNRTYDELGARYPLATAQPWLTARGREVVRRAQEGVPGRLSFTVVRSGQQQLVLDPRAQSFVDSVEWDQRGDFARSLRPLPDVPEVVCDPLRQVGEPTIDGVPVDVIAEQVRVGEPLDAIAEVYGLTLAQITAAMRYELKRVDRGSEAAAA